MSARGIEVSMTITEEHLTLLRNMNVRMDALTEYGAPYVDPKRPYGNGDVPAVIYRLLGWSFPCCEPCGVDWGDERARSIHDEMTDVLQIALTHHGEAITGDWHREPYDDWKRTEATR